MVGKGILSTLKFHAYFGRHVSKQKFEILPT